MESSRSKRRRLMLSYISSRPRPDVPAIFESLNDDTLTTVLEFVGDKSYRSFGGLNKHCKEIYIASGMSKETFLFGYGSLSVIRARVTSYYTGRYSKAVGKGVVFHNRSDVMVWALQERKNSVLKGIFYVAAEEGRLDLLNEMWNNIDDKGYKRYVFGGVDTHAARGGKLNVLKWLETRGLYLNKEGCAEAASRGGQLHILQWLKEEKGFELYRELYHRAIDGGHLHVMKWLREKACPWSDCTFHYAVKEGNLDILQWLHDEGCPWPEHPWFSVSEDNVKPEVIDWCRVNGYGNRIQDE